MPRVSNPKFFQNASAKLKTVYCFADVYPNSFAHEANMSTLVPYYSYSTLLFKSLGAVRFLFLKEIYTFIQQGCVQLIKSGSKDNYMVQKQNECCSFEAFQGDSSNDFWRIM